MADFLRFSNPSRAREASPGDIEDAIDHMSDETPLRLKDFSKKTRHVSLKELARYDDFGSWPEWRPGELIAMDADERHEALVSFRGEEWAERAEGWTPSTVPTIVVVDADRTAIADGRGRVSYAIGMGWTSMPATFLR